MVFAGGWELVRVGGHDRKESIVTHQGVWRKSSYSANANNCVEIGGWRKATYSNNNTACVEVGHGIDTVAVRDTKDRDAGMLTVSVSEWRGFLVGLTS